MLGDFQLACKEAMEMLAEDPRVLFLGQQAVYPGQAMHDTLVDIDPTRRIEMPVAEELQLGICTGLALLGYIPICLYPRVDFMLRAMDQLVNHLDKLPEISDGQFVPKMIIRTAVGRAIPLDPGPQHRQDHVGAFRQMLQSIPIWNIRRAEDIKAAYRVALAYEGPTMIVEHLGQ